MKAHQISDSEKINTKCYCLKKWKSYHELNPAHVRDGLPDVGVDDDLLEDLEAADLALDVVRLEEVDQDLQPASVHDGHLVTADDTPHIPRLSTTRLAEVRRQVEVCEVAERDDGGSLVTNLQVPHQLLDLETKY